MRYSIPEKKKVLPKVEENVEKKIEDEIKVAKVISEKTHDKKSKK